MGSELRSTLRCFKRKEKGEFRHGIWLMLEGRRGEFFHGERDETQAPRHTLDELVKWSETGKGFLNVEEISLKQVLFELGTWLEGRRLALKLFREYPVGCCKLEGK